jgi:hypothetical protein
MARREILVHSLRGLLAGRPQLALDTALAEPVPYPDLARFEAADAPAGPAPIFVTGRFRSGSTLLWNIFRHIDGCTSYYEPLNERRWFDPGRRGDRIDADAPR